MNNDTRIIRLTQGFVTVIDASDYEFLNQWNWYYADGYATKFYKGRPTKMHSFLVPAPDGMVTDHINRDSLDNRRCNLRICTPQQNKQNKNQYKKKSKNASQYKGVFWMCTESRVKRWNARITVNKKRMSLGTYFTEEEAAIAYDAAARFYFGEFAATNFDGTEAMDVMRLRQLARI